MADYNTDIQAGPVMSELPTLYSPNQDVGRATPRFDSSGFAGEAFQRLPLDVALKAMEGAIQLEGMLGYDADIKAGVPTSVAISKWSPKLFHRNPSAVHQFTQAPFQPTVKEVGGHQLIQTSPNRFQLAPQGQPAGPIEAQSVMGPGGEALPGVTAIRGRGGSVHVIPEKAQGPGPTQLGMLVNHQLNDIGLQLRDVGAEGGIAENSPEHKALLQKQKKFRADLERITEEALAGTKKVAHPKVGEVRNGYRFKGGDPKKQSSWEKVG